MLSLFANLIYYFPGELALFHTLMSWACLGRAGRVPDETWACPRRELGVSQTRAGRVPDESWACPRRVGGRAGPEY